MRHRRERRREPGARPAPRLQPPAQARHQTLPQVRHGLGRHGRGHGPGLGTRVRQTAPPVLDLGGGLATGSQEATALLPQAPHRREAPRQRRWGDLEAARAAPRQIAPHAPRLTHGKKRGPGHIVQAYAPPMAPLSPGKSHGPAQCGRHIGLRSAPVSGLRLAPRVPTGQPREPRAGWPMRDKGPQASALVTSPTRWPLHALGGERGGNDAARRHALPARGMLPVGMPTPVEPRTPVPSPADVRDRLNGSGFHRMRPPHPVPLACASGSRRPGVERHRATLMSRGADHVRDKGLEGAGVQSGMTVIAPNGAVLVRLCPQRLSKRGQKCRR